MSPAKNSNAPHTPATPAHLRFHSAEQAMRTPPPVVISCPCALQKDPGWGPAIVNFLVAQTSVCVLSLPHYLVTSLRRSFTATHHRSQIMPHLYRRRNAAKMNNSSSTHGHPV